MDEPDHFTDDATGTQIIFCRGHHFVADGSIDKASVRAAICFAGDQIDPERLAVGKRHLASPEGLCQAVADAFGLCFLVLPAHNAEGMSIFSNLIDQLDARGRLTPAGIRTAAGATLERMTKLVDALDRFWTHSKAYADGRPTQLQYDLVGFSKGNVVMAALLADICRSPSSISQAKWLRKGIAFHLVDPGMGGPGLMNGVNNNAPVLAKLLTAGDLRLQFHGTPRQWKSQTTPWNKFEIDVLLDALFKKQAQPSLRWYYPTEEPKLEQHFTILQDLQLSHVFDDACQGKLELVFEVQRQWSGMIFSGDKTVETRSYAPPSYVPYRPIGILESPEGGLREHGLDSGILVGFVVFGRHQLYKSKDTWIADRKRHGVPLDSPFAFNGEKPLYGWQVLHAHRFQQPVDINPFELVREHRSVFRLVALTGGDPAST